MTPRGADPDDPRRFDGDGLRRLREAARDLAWMLDRAYPLAPSLALVGDRHALDARARLALQRGVAGERVCASRRARCVDASSLAGAELSIDALNLVVTLEVALSGGPLFVGLDGALRDLAGLRGSYRMLPETDRALDLLAVVVRELSIARCRWWVDAPVSHSGALASRLRAWHDALGVPGEVALVHDADAALAGRPLAVSSDARVLDECASWAPLASLVVASIEPAPWVIDLSRDG